MLVEHVDHSSTGLYRALRWLLKLALGFYFRRIEPFHRERVPALGPVLFASNHPNSLTDSFLLGACVSRKVNFVATVQLFRVAPLKWLLTRCGVIPINRVRDDPHAMRTVAGTFAACFQVLESGQAVGIFPEGVTYDDSQLKEVKTGVARMALELEHRHVGTLGLQIVPVGLTYSAKEKYRSDVLVHFGLPIKAAEFLAGYPERRKECITQLTAELTHRLQALLIHLPTLERERLVAGIKRLYLTRVQVGNSILPQPTMPAGEELLLTQRIAQVVDHVYTEQPAVARAFAARLHAYEHALQTLRIADEQVALVGNRRNLFWQTLLWATLAFLGAPVALFGWLHRLLPFLVVAWAVRAFPEPTKRKAQASTATLLAGVIAFGFFYSAYVLLFYSYFGWPAVLWYALALPLASLLAHYYLRELRRLRCSLRLGFILLRAPLAGRRLLARRNALISEIEAVRARLGKSETEPGPPLRAG